jgi:hypothetical protein
LNSSVNWRGGRLGVGVGVGVSVIGVDIVFPSENVSTESDQAQQAPMFVAVISNLVRLLDDPAA